MRIYTLVFLAILFASCKKSNNTGPVEELGEPVIKTFTPSGNVGDTVWITGKNFSKTAQNNIAKFGIANGTTFKSIIHTGNLADSLAVVVPPGASSDILKLSIYSQSISAKDSFYVTTGRWIKRASCPSGGRFSGAAFSIGNKGYIGMGTGEGSASGPYLKDL